jgi:hypothetical protein
MSETESKQVFETEPKAEQMWDLTTEEGRSKNNAVAQEMWDLAIEEDRLKKNAALQQAFNQTLKEAQLTKKELADLWENYSYLYDRRSRRSYDHVPVRLPLRKSEKTQNRKSKKNVSSENDVEENYDLIRLPGTNLEFSRNHFYSGKRFQDAMRQYYWNLGHSISFVKTGYSWLIKVYMN